MTRPTLQPLSSHLPRVQRVQRVEPRKCNESCYVCCQCCAVATHCAPRPQGPECLAFFEGGSSVDANKPIPSCPDSTNTPSITIPLCKAKKDWHALNLLDQTQHNLPAICCISKIVVVATCTTSACAAHVVCYRTALSNLAVFFLLSLSLPPSLLFAASNQGDLNTIYKRDSCNTPGRAFCTALLIASSVKDCSQSLSQLWIMAFKIWSLSAIASSRNIYIYVSLYLSPFLCILGLLSLFVWRLNLLKSFVHFH